MSTGTTNTEIETNAAKNASEMCVESLQPLLYYLTLHNVSTFSTRLAQ